MPLAIYHIVLLCYNPRMKKTYQILGLLGAILWAGTVLLREMGIAFSPPAAFLLGILPNAGSALLCMSIFVSFCPMVRKHESTKGERYWAIAAIMALQLLSEIIHALFLGAPFDIYDMIASAAAAAVLALVNMRSVD